jgi:hypothetical protein
LLIFDIWPQPKGHSFDLLLRKVRNVGCHILIKMWQELYQFVSTNTPFISFVLPWIKFCCSSLLLLHNALLLSLAILYLLLLPLSCYCTVISSLSISLLHKFISSLLTTALAWPFNFQVSLNMLTYNALSRPRSNLNCLPTFSFRLECNCLMV